MQRSNAIAAVAKGRSFFDPAFAGPDPEIKSAKALVIDGNPTSRSILAGMLRDFGFGAVIQTARVVDARRQLENRSFDVVLCDYHFDGANYTGQDLLDDLRRAQLLPYSTVFIMVTGEASYAKVAEAAESALDGYLLKPHTSATLSERVHQARHRKKALRDIFEAIENEDFETAARLCLERFHARAKYWLFAARIGAELLLRLNRHDEARELFEAVMESHAVPWARLGVARAQVDGGQAPQARRMLETLLADEPSYADAYDVMGRVQVEQGDLQEALQTYRRASELTPNSIARLQKQGMLAFYMGETEEATRSLERAVSIGITSKMFDYQSCVLLALSQFDKRDHKGVNRCYDNIAHMAERVPESRRLQSFVRMVNVLRLMLARQLAQVVVEIKQIASEVREPSFDFEAASNLVATLGRVRLAEVQLADDELWIGAIARRFCVSKATAELLAQAGRSWPEYGQRVRSEYAAVMSSAEKAMTLSVRGNPGGAARALLTQGQQSLNAKLIDMARAVVLRYRDRVPDAAELTLQIDELRERYVTGTTGTVQLGQTGTRQAGGVSLRTDAAPPRIEPTAAAPGATAAKPALGPGTIPLGG